MWRDWRGEDRCSCGCGGAGTEVIGEDLGGDGVIDKDEVNDDDGEKNGDEGEERKLLPLQ